MDTGLKRFNLNKLKKAVAVIICLLCVSGITGQTVTTIHKMMESELVYVNFSDALYHNILGVEEDEWQYTTFKNGYTHLLSLLNTKMRDYGNGTKEDYTKRVKEYEKQRKAVIKENRNNIIAAASSDFYDFYELYERGLIEIIATDVIGETSDVTEYYDHGFDYDIRFYDYEHFNGRYDEPVLPESVTEEFKNIEYDSVIYFDSTRKVLTDYSDTEDVVKEIFTPGYYAFKVNDSILEGCLYKNGIISTYFSSYEEFYQSYLDTENQIIEHAETARYFIRDGKGNVITNVDGLKADTKAEDIKNTFSSFGTYSYNQDGSIYLSNGRYYSDTYLDWLTENDSVYFEAEGETVATTMCETTSVTNAYGDTVTAAPSPTAETKLYTDESEQAVTIPQTTSVSRTVITSADITDSSIELYIAVDKNAQSETCHFANLRNNVERAADYIKDFAVTCGILGIILLTALIYLIAVTGRRKGSKEAYLYRGDKIFVEIRTAIDVGLGFLCVLGIAACISIIAKPAGSTVIYLATVILADILFLLFLDLVLFYARHIKNRSIFKNISIIWLIRKLWTKVKKSADKLLYTKELKTTVIIRTVIVIVINIIAGSIAFLCAVSHGGEIALMTVIALFLFDLFVVYRGLRFAGGVHKLFALVKEMHKGNLDINIDRNALPPYLLLPAEDLQCLSDGMKEAVNEAIKQERTKTELITNVSHDLKTPLTSIINYVDFLKKCDIKDETAVSYLNVLSEKSDRLKVLIEDLVEASKASAGAIAVNFVSVSLKELINQILGEFEESFEDKNLRIILDIPEGDIRIKADSKLIYRVLENLFVNIKKYALENTRVYITVSERNDRGMINLKNISAAPLNISADELKERFVRGEQSRTTEGNGLGLSIAENLCTLQNGSLRIEINGDLFSVTVEMEKSKEYINL